MSAADDRQIPDEVLPPFPESAWRGVFKRYRALIDHISECPTALHFSNLLAVTAAELGDAFRLHEGAATYLNFYIFNCGRSGTKKSTASDLVHDNITQYMQDRVHASATSVSSGEGLVRMLLQHPNLLMRFDEIKDLFTTASRAGSRLEPILNAAFNLRPVQANVKKVRDSLSADIYYYNMVMNGTKVHVQQDCNEAFFKGGMLPRMLTFVVNMTDKDLPQLLVPDVEALEALAIQLSHHTRSWHAMFTTRGSVRVRLSEEAAAVHAEWYFAHNQRQRERPDHEADPLNRLDTYMKKLAAVYCITETNPEPFPEVTGAQMRAARDVIGYCEASMLILAHEWTGPRPVGAQADVINEQRVETWLEKRGCTDERKLSQGVKLSYPELTRVLTGMGAKGLVNVTAERPRKVHVAATCACFGVSLTVAEPENPPE